jgi:hypothetical protein
LLLQKVINKALCALGQSEIMQTETLEHNLSHESRHYIDVNHAQIRLIASRGILGHSVVQERTVLVCLVLKPYRNMPHGMLDALSSAPTAFSDMGLDAIDVFTLLEIRTLEIKHATPATSRSVLMDSRCAWNALITYQPMPNIRRQALTNILIDALGDARWDFYTMRTEPLACRAPAASLIIRTGFWMTFKSRLL